jgi:hypothetical protein
MIVTQLNPSWVRPEDYIGLLNRGFRNQWNHRSFQWYQCREFNGRPTDIAVRAEGNRLLAVATYCYRQIIDPAGRTMDVCVMGSTTTVADQRGCGHYSALLQAGLALCRRHACGAMLGFATRSNGSCRGFLGLGGYSIPSYYIFSPRDHRNVHPLRRAPLQPSRHFLDLLRTRAPQQSRQLRFHYARRQDWLDQFVQRPAPVHALRVAHDCTALVERVGDTDRLQWLEAPPHRAVAALATLAGASVASGRRFFMFTMNAMVAAATRRLGLTTREGGLLVLPVDRSKSALGSFSDEAWDVHSGDRM